MLRRIENDAPIAERYAVQVSVAYKGVWARAARCCSKSAAPMSWRAAQDWFAKCFASLDTSNYANGPSSANCPGTLVAWSIEAAVGHQPLAAIASGGAKGTGESIRVPAGTHAVLCVHLQLPDGPWHGALPFILGSKSSRALGT